MKVGESGVSAIFDFPQVSLNVCAVADTITEHMLNATTSHKTGSDTVARTAVGGQRS